MAKVLFRRETEGTKVTRKNPLCYKQTISIFTLLPAWGPKERSQGKRFEGVVIRNARRIIPGQMTLEKRGEEHQSEANDRKAPQAWKRA